MIPFDFLGAPKRRSSSQSQGAMMPSSLMQIPQPPQPPQAPPMTPVQPIQPPAQAQQASAVSNFVVPSLINTGLQPIFSEVAKKYPKQAGMIDPLIQGLIAQQVPAYGQAMMYQSMMAPYVDNSQTGQLTPESLQAQADALAAQQSQTQIPSAPAQPAATTAAPATSATTTPTTTTPTTTTPTNASSTNAPAQNQSSVNYRDVASSAAMRYDIPSDIFMKQIQAESGFNPNAVSPAGARGIAQFMPGTAQGMGIDPNDPIQALDAAARLMKHYYTQYGSWRNALIAYNAGEGTLQNYLAGKSDLPDETKQYLKEILG